MKIDQVVVTGQNQVELQQFELDDQNLAANELVIKTEYSFISAGTELANYTATDKDVFRAGTWCAYPWKSGYANIGEVLDAGEKYRSYIGQRVYTNGPHASAHRYATNVQVGLIAPVPEGISLEEAVAARMAMVAICGLDASTPRYIRWVVVIGLGMVGNLAAQLYRLTGAQVIGVDPSEARRKTALACGIPHAISGTEEEVAAQVRQITGGKMAHVTVDAVGHSSIVMQALRLTADAGEVVILGTPRTPVTGDLTEVFRAAHIRWVTIKGCLEWNVPTEAALPHEYSQRKKIDAIFSWIMDGRLKLRPLITHILPPTEIKTAYEGLLHKKEEYVGVVLKWAYAQSDPLVRE